MPYKPKKNKKSVNKFVSAFDKETNDLMIEQMLFRSKRSKETGVKYIEYIISLGKENKK